MAAIDQIIIPNLWLLVLLLPMSWYAYTILRLKSRPKNLIGKTSTDSLPFISVLVPFRNESRWISTLLESLKKQDYPAELWELIMVDDHSLDSGPVLVRKAMNELQAKTHFVRLEKGYGKKEAMTQGVALAQSEWILATDADCSFGKGWLRSYGEMIASQDSGMICGPVMFYKEAKGWLSTFQKFEQAILMFVSRSSLLAGRAFLANGANMAFKKSYFIKADLKEEYTASGDDIFLLHHIKQKEPDKLLFNDSEDAIVFTPPKQSVLRFLDQRIRWASKSRYYQDVDSMIYGMAIALGNGVLLLGLILFLLNFLNLYSILILTSIKLLVDAIIFFRARHYSDLNHPWLSFLLIFMVYPFYTIGIALLSLLYKPRWKGRKI